MPVVVTTLRKCTDKQAEEQTGRTALDKCNAHLYPKAKTCYYADPEVQPT